MVATRYPGEVRQVHTPSQWQQGNPHSQQNFQGLQHQTELQPSWSMSAEVRGSLASLTFERTRMQNVDYSRGTHSGSYPLLKNTAFLTSKTMKDEASPVEDIESFTQRMLVLIAERTAQMTSVMKNGHTSSTTKANSPTTTVPAQAIEGHSSKGNAEEATSTSENHSTENLQTMGKVAATCKKDGGRSPVVMTTVLSVTLKEPTEKQHRSTLHSSSSQEERKSPRLDADKTVDDLDRLPGVLGDPKHVPERNQLERSPESVEGVRFDKVHGLAENVQTKSELVKKTFEPPSQNDLSGNGKNESAQQNSNLPDGNKMMKIQIDGQCVPSSQSGAVGDKGSVKEIVSAEFEDVSETSQPETNCNAHSEGLNCPSWYRELQFEDVSEESENEAMGEPSFSLGSQDTLSDGEQMLCEQSVACMKQESIPDENLKEKSVSPKTVDFDQVHQTSHSFCNETDNEESNDEWIVIPVTISDLRYEPGSEDQEGVEKIQLDEVTETQCNRNQTLWSGLTKASTFASSAIEVFETVDSFKQATGVHVIDTFEFAPSRSTPDCERDNGEEPVPQKSSEQNSESEDSCDTEDSCDYPPESRRNHMTVSGHFFGKTLAPLTPAPFVTMVDTDGQQDKNVPNRQTTDLNKMTEKLRQILQAKAGIKQKTSGENISKKQHVTLIDPDSDEEIHQRRRKKVKKRFSLRSESSEDSSCSQHGKHSPERVDTRKDSLPSIDLQALQCSSLLSDAQSRAVMQTKATPEAVQHETEKHVTLNKDTKTTESDSVSKMGQNCKQGSGVCEELKETIQDPCSDQQTEANVDSNMHTVLNDVIIIDSDTEDESDYNLKNNANKKRLSSSSSTHKDDSTRINQPPSQQRLKLHDEEFKRALSSKTDSEPVQHKVDMQKISTTEDVIILSESDDDSDINNKKQNKTTLVTSRLAGSNDTICASEEKCKETTLPFTSSSLPKHSSNLHDTRRNEPEQDTCSRWTNGENMSQTEAKDGSENVQHRTRLKVSDKTKVLTDANREHRKKHLCKKVSFKKRILSSSEGRNSEADCSSEERLLPEPQYDHHETVTRKPEAYRQFSEYLSKRLPQSMDKRTDSVMASNPLIPPLLVSNTDPIHGRLRLTSLPPGSSNVCGQTQKNSSMIQATVVKPPLVSRQFSFPPSVHPSTSSSDMSSSSGPRREAKRISVPSSDLPSSGVFKEGLNHFRSRLNTCTPRLSLTSAKAKPSNSYRSPTTPDQICSPTECPSYSPTLTRTKLLESWKSTFPNKGEFRRRRRRRRPWMNDNLGPTCHESSKEVLPRPSHDPKKEVRPGPSHSDLSDATRPVSSRTDPLRAAKPESRGRKRRAQRIRSLETTAPLMKKTRIDYSQLPKATNRDPAQGQSYPVGENYKWGQPKKGPSTSREGKKC